MNEKCKRCFVKSTCTVETKIHCLGSSETIVVNKKYKCGTIYIGRGSKFGNKYVIGPDGTREDVIAKHKKDFYNDPELQEAVWNELTGEILECFCKPLACHGDTYVEYIRERMRKNDERV